MTARPPRTGPGPLALLVAFATCVAGLPAVDIARAAAEAMGGKGGGGRPDMAQAGGADPTQTEGAIRAAEAVIAAAARVVA